MPEMRHYLVTQTRQVHVRATSAREANHYGSSAFEVGLENLVSEDRGHIVDQIREVSLKTEEVK